jgi:hypothetical protein
VFACFGDVCACVFTYMAKRYLIEQVNPKYAAYLADRRRQGKTSFAFRGGRRSGKTFFLHFACSPNMLRIWD